MKHSNEHEKTDSQNEHGEGKQDNQALRKGKGKTEAHDIISNLKCALRGMEEASDIYSHPV